MMLTHRKPERFHAIQKEQPTKINTDAAPTQSLIVEPLTEEDQQALEDMLVAVDQLVGRVESLESILDADHPDWRQSERSKASKEQQS